MADKYKVPKTVTVLGVKIPRIYVDTENHNTYVYGTPRGRNEGVTVRIIVLDGNPPELRYRTVVSVFTGKSSDPFIGTSKVCKSTAASVRSAVSPLWLVQDARAVELEKERVALVHLRSDIDVILATK